MKENYSFEWANKELNPNCKHLLLGSFTSDAGADHYYYASSRNHFWYLLDAVLNFKSGHFKGKECRDIKKEIIGCNGFAKLISDLKATSNSEEKKLIRAKIRSLLNSYSFDIIDLFKAVQVINTNCNDDSNIIVKKSKWNDLDKLITNNYQIIFCTSQFVKKELLNKYPSFMGKTRLLAAPTTNNRMKLEKKIENWECTFNLKS